MRQKNKGTAVKKREDVHRMAEANKGLLITAGNTFCAARFSRSTFLNSKVNLSKRIQSWLVKLLLSATAISVSVLT